MQLVLDTNGLTVKKRNGAFWIWAKEGRRMISPQRVTSIAVTADCLLSSAAIRLAADHGIPIYFFDRTGQADARLWSANFGSIATIRREQVLFALKPEATAWVVELFRLKTAHQADVLRMLARRKRNTREGKELERGLAQLEEQAKALANVPGVRLPEARSSLLGIEGNLAKQYWAQVAAAMPEAFRFAGRSRRPAQDPFNAALNYGYGMLYHVVTSAAMAAGLDPYLGFFHVDGYNRPSLAFDLIEPFRPWVDEVIIQSCLDGTLLAGYTEQTERGCMLTQAGRHWLITKINEALATRRMFQHRRLEATQHLYRFAGEFARQLLLNPSEDEDILDLL